MKGRPSKSGPQFEHGVYEVQLQEVNCYVADNFNTKEPEVNLTFIWNMGEDPDNPNQDLLYFDGFVTLYQDEEGYPVIGGKRGKMYKRFYALLGEDFDPFDESLDFEIVFPDQYDDPEALMQLPHWQSFSKDDLRPKVKSIRINGSELIGKECQIELGHAQKPDGTFSTKTSVIDVKPMPRRRPAKRKPAREEVEEVEEEQEELPV